MFTIEQMKQISEYLINDFKKVFATKQDFDEFYDRIYQLNDSLQKSISQILDKRKVSRQK